MIDLWDYSGDAVVNGDCLRECCPVSEKTYFDNFGYTHYTFKRTMFNNPKYIIPSDDKELLKNSLMEDLVVIHQMVR